MTAKIDNVSINEGQNAEFICRFVSNPEPSNIIWYKNDTEEIQSNDRFEMTTTTSLSTLKLINAKSTDNGTTFSVKIINLLGEVVSNKSSLNVSCGPVFEVEPLDQKVLKDKEVKFECIVKSNPKPNVSWLLNGKEFTTRDGVRIEKDINKDKYSLVLPKTTTSHVGTITARAVNEFGTVEKNAQLDVLDVPRVLNKLENITVNENDVAKFTIKYSGKPKPLVKWFKDDLELEINEQIEINESNEDEVSLIIKSSQSPENVGNYYAKVINEFGEVSTNKAVLTINSQFFRVFSKISLIILINFTF